MNNEPHNYDDFDTQIQSDELIPEWEDELPLGEWEPDYYGHDADGYDGGDDFPW